MPPPPIPLPPRSELAVASMTATILGVFPLPFLGSLVGLVLGVLALIQRYRRGYALRKDNLVLPSLLLSTVVPLLHAWVLWQVLAFLRNLLMTLVCAAMLYSSNCPYL
ncbi:hypothetical protein [Stenotrophomonas sp.]|uniref:hypothetical protein n=1 Tax=Stenotrophomonas sp. TaxID=69392 RepID=UPI002899B794|nr:hypothetical protein [Stenotrophomonas sp.]